MALRVPIGQVVRVGLALAACWATTAAAGEDGAARRTVTLAYFADLHGQLEGHPELFWNEGRDELTEAGGVARIATAVDRIRRDRPGRVLFFDAGDTIQGSAAAAWTEGRALIPALNALGLDLAIPGNWEVVYGKRAMLDRTGSTRHPWVAANVRDAETHDRIFAPYRIFEVDGLRVAVVGFTDPDVPERQPPSYSRGLAFDGPEVLPPLIAEVRSEGRADLVVLLAHVGLPKAIALAERVEGIDVVLSGDTHERTYEPIVRGRTWIVEPGGFGSFLGRLDVTFEGGRIAERRWELIELRADRFEEDPAVKAVVDATLEPLRPRLERPIGETAVPLIRYDVVETNLDAVLADAIREATGAEVAISNGFRFAGPTPPGPILERDLWNWYPINAPIKTGKVNGRQLRAFWERELENVFAADPTRLFGGWLPRPSGLSVRFEARAPAGERVREITVAGRPLEDDRLYTVASCEREGDAPDRLCRIPGVRDPQVLDLDAHTVVRRHLARHRPITRPEPGRVVALDLPSRVRSQVLGTARPAGD